MDGMEDRYRRQYLVASVGEEGQKRIQSARVAVVGAGALGGAIHTILARAGVAHLTIIDRDRVEWSNLPRQILFS